jgi:hypothetical protein
MANPIMPYIRHTDSARSEILFLGSPFIVYPPVNKGNESTQFLYVFIIHKVSKFNYSPLESFRYTHRSGLLQTHRQTVLSFYAGHPTQ